MDTFRRGFLLLLVVAVSLVFFAMIREFLAALLLAALVSALAQPVYRRLVRWFRGHQGAASGVTVLLILLAVIVPLLGVLGIVVAQAVEITQDVSPAVQRLIQEPGRLERFIERTPILRGLAPYKNQIVSKAGELATWLGGFIVATVGAATRGTATFFFKLFVMLYAAFFFLKDGRTILARSLTYLPLTPEDEEQLLERFASVFRATIKGTFIIGVLQGTLNGLAFAVLGIQGAVFWGALMAVLSMIPGVGGALIWIPAAIFLIVDGRVFAAIVLMVWGGLVVGSVDNVLRPRLVGRDTQMSDLLVLLGTLGGIILFGAVGVLIGPIVAALFVTIWSIYGVAFAEYLPEEEVVVEEVAKGEEKGEGEGKQG